MSKSTSFTFRVNPETKNEVAKLYAEYGLTLSDAINLFLRQSLLEGGLPFEVTRVSTSGVAEEGAIKFKQG